MTSRKDCYYYGQGQVFLSEVNGSGKPVNWKFIGDVSSLAVQISVNKQINKKESINGELVVTNSFIVDKTGLVTMTWHDYATENIALLTCGNAITITPTFEETTEELPTGIASGTIISLDYQSVFALTIPGLEPGVDYTLDSTWGTVEFLKTPINQPLLATYRHGKSDTASLFNRKIPPLALRYQGVNLAENNAPVLVYLYRIQLSPADALSLINNENNVSGANTSALMMADTNRKHDPRLGLFGQYSVLHPLGVRHNGQIKRNRTYNYQGRRI